MSQTGGGRATQNRATSNRATPNRGTTNRAATNHATPNHATPNRAATNHTAPNHARRLTPEQRRRILEKRRRQRRRRQLMVAIPAALVALIAVAVGLSFALGGRKGSDEPAGPAMPVAAVVETQAEPDVAGETIGEGADLNEAAETDASTSEAEGAALPEEQAGDTQAQGASSAVPANADGTFTFDTAYADAVHGDVTGPSVTPDMSSVDPAKLDRWPAAKNGYIPVLYNAENVTEKVIAVTVDDCFQPGNLRQIVQCALNNGAKLTIFPIGRNLEKQGIADTVKWAWENGMEIENHTYSHSGTYHYADDKMAMDIWYQSYLLNQALGVNYKQHFYRPKGGDEHGDQRAHAYASQLGMRGIAIWTMSGSSNSASKILKSLKPGGIYLYHTTDKDLNSLLQLIPAAVQQGYRLVTLNELFGLPENETSDLSTASQTAPELEAFQVMPLSIKKTSYMRAAAAIQERLIELGWMKGDATGVYGDSTRASMMLFQAASGLSADGVAGAETQRLLFSDGAEAGSEQRVRELGAKLDKDAQKAIREMFT